MGVKSPTRQSVERQNPMSLIVFAIRQRLSKGWNGTNTLGRMCGTLSQQADAFAKKKFSFDNVGLSLTPLAKACTQFFQHENQALYLAVVSQHSFTDTLIRTLTSEVHPLRRPPYSPGEREVGLAPE